MMFLKHIFHWSLVFLVCLSCIEKKYIRKDGKLVGNLQDYVRTCPTIITDVFENIYDEDERLPFVCGEMKVPLRHESPDTLKILGLQFIYFSPSGGSGENPVVMTQGGPGGSSVNLMLASYRSWKNIIEEHGLIIFEYRGTDFSDPDMKCRYVKLNDQDEEQARRQVAQCADFWNEKFDIAAINSTQVAHDLAYLTQKIGFPRFHFYGVSYGTLIGQYLARLYPDRLNSLILDGVVEYGKDWNTGYDVLNYALKKVEKTCDSDLYCRSVYGAAHKELKIARERLNKSPVKIYENVSINGEMFISHLMQAMYSYQKVPHVYRMLSGWQNKNLLKRYINPEYAREINVVYMTVYCNERALSINRFRLTEDKNDQTDWKEEMCRYWVPGGTRMKKLTLSEKAKNIPVMLISGEFDPVTPDYNGDAVAGQFKEPMHLKVRGYSHGVFLDSDCVAGAVFKFIHDPAHRPEKELCDIKTEFRPEFIESDTYFLSFGDDVTIPGWTAKDQHIWQKGNSELRVLHYRFVGSAKEVFWLQRELSGGEALPLKTATMNVGTLKWQLVSSAFKEKDQFMSMALIPSRGSWLGLLVTGDQDEPVPREILEVASLLLTSDNGSK